MAPMNQSPILTLMEPASMPSFTRCSSGEAKRTLMSGNSGEGKRDLDVGELLVEGGGERPDLGGRQMPFLTVLLRHRVPDRLIIARGPMLSEDAAPLDVGIGPLGERANKPDTYVFLLVSDAQVDVVLGRDQFSLDRPALPTPHSLGTRRLYST
jgi:hypothetical protein